MFYRKTVKTILFETVITKKRNKMKRLYAYLLVFFSFSSHYLFPLQAEKKELTVLVVMHACNNLESFAVKNLRSMLKVGSNHNLNILVELHRPGDKAWRYKINKNNCITDEIIPRPANPDMSQELYNAADWAIRKYPSKKFALILWNHGYGILDPVWSVGQSSYMKRRNLATSRATKNLLAHDRSILFDEQRGTYLSNQGLKKALNRISKNLLHGKKIDFVGADACLMGMLECSYLMRDDATGQPLVKTFTASQEFEFAQGWSYGPLMQRLSQGNVTPELLGKTVVQTYKEYFQARTHYFTLSSVDVDKVDLIKESIDAISKDLLIGLDQSPEKFKKCIMQARLQSLAFSVPDYFDLHSFFHELYQALKRPGINQELGIERSLCDRLSYNLLLGKKIIKRAVTANATGRYLSRAQGISIYFPQKAIDPSYVLTNFAQESMWLDVLCRLTQD